MQLIYTKDESLNGIPKMETAVLNEISQLWVQPMILCDNDDCGNI